MQASYSVFIYFYKHWWDWKFFRSQAQQSRNTLQSIFTAMFGSEIHVLGCVFLLQQIKPYKKNVMHLAKIIIIRAWKDKIINGLS